VKTPVSVDFQARTRKEIMIKAHWNAPLALLVGLALLGDAGASSQMSQQVWQLTGTITSSSGAHPPPLAIGQELTVDYTFDLAAPFRALLPGILDISDALQSVSFDGQTSATPGGGFLWISDDLLAINTSTSARGDGIDFLSLNDFNPPAPSSDPSVSGALADVSNAIAGGATSSIDSLRLDGPGGSVWMNLASFKPVAVAEPPELLLACAAGLALAASMRRRAS
jgi:hypothetical protein